MKIIGNTNYREFNKDSSKIKVTVEQANFLENVLNRINVQFSGVVYDTNGIITVHAADKDKVSDLIADMKIGENLRAVLGDNYNISYQRDGKRAITHKTSGEVELFDNLSAALFEFERRNAAMQLETADEPTNDVEIVYIADEINTLNNELQEAMSGGDISKVQEIINRIHSASGLAIEVPAAVETAEQTISEPESITAPAESQAVEQEKAENTAVSENIEKIHPENFGKIKFKKYVKGTPDEVREIIRQLDERGITASGRIDGNKATVTVNGKNNQQIARDILSEIQNRENPVSEVVEEFRKRTDDNFKGLDGMTYPASAFEDEIKAYVEDIFENNELDARIKGIALYGSRSRGVENADSDIDFVIEVESDLKEDALFNIINEDSYYMNDTVKVDINPIKADESGTLETYLPKAEQYLSDKIAEKAKEAEKHSVKYEIYQLPAGEKYHGIRFESLDMLKKFNLQVNHEDYDLIYSGEISSFKGNASLEALYTQFNINHPEDYKGHSLSMSDIIVVTDGDKQTAYYCDRIGFTEFPEFFQEKIILEDIMPPMFNDDYQHFNEKQRKAYFASIESIRKIGTAIHKAINDTYEDPFRFDVDVALKNVLGKFDRDKVAYVLARYIDWHREDGRISRNNIQWADNMLATLPQNAKEIRGWQGELDQVHATVNNELVRRFREEYFRKNYITYSKGILTNTEIELPYIGKIDFENINSLFIDYKESSYIGGIDSDGHEAKDNYSLVSDGIELSYNGHHLMTAHKGEMGEYYENVKFYDLTDTESIQRLKDEIESIINSAVSLNIYTEDEEGIRKISLSNENAIEKEIIKTEPPFGIKDDHTTILTAPPTSLDTILRCGSNENHSIERIAAQFLKGKSIEENAAFLAKEFGVGGKGYYIGEKDEEVSAWFDKEGITFAAGDTAFPVGVNSFVTWEEAAERIQRLFEKGEYCSQDILNIAPEYDREHIAADIWYLHQDLEEDVEFFLPVEYFRGGFPDNIARISEELKNSDFLERVEKGLSEFADRYAADRDILRFHHHIPSEIHGRVRDLMGEHKNYTTRADFDVRPSFFISEDEKDHLLTHGSGVSGGKFRIETFFKDEHTEREQIDFLKNEYGTGGSASGGIDEWHDSKGIEYKKAAFYPTVDAEYQMKWNEAAKRISRLVKDEKYITAEDIAKREQAIKWEQEHNNSENDEPELPLDRAKAVITAFCEREYAVEGEDYQVDFSDLHNIGLAYTEHTDKNGVELPYQVSADLIDFTITYELDGRVFNTEHYENIQDMISNGLSGIYFDGLMADADEFVEKHEYIDFIAQKVSDINADVYGDKYNDSRLSYYASDLADGDYYEWDKEKDVYNNVYDALLSNHTTFISEFLKDAVDESHPDLQTVLDRISDYRGRYIKPASEQTVLSGIEEIKEAILNRNIKLGKPDYYSEQDVDEFLHDYETEKALTQNSPKLRQALIENINKMFHPFLIRRLLELVNNVGQPNYGNEEQVIEKMYEGMKYKIPSSVFQTLNEAERDNLTRLIADIREANWNETKYPHNITANELLALYDTNDAAKKIIDYLQKKIPDYNFDVHRLENADEIEDFKAKALQLIEKGNKQEAISANSEWLHIDGYSDTWSVINNMTYGSKELYLLANDEVGDETPYLIVDSDMNVLYDKGYSFEDFTSVYTASEVGLGLVPDKAITFTVAEFDDGTKTVVFDGRYDMDDVQKTDEYQEYYDTTEYDDIRVHLEQYTIGTGEFSDLTEEQIDYINNHLATVKRNASLLESESETFEHEYYSDIVKDMGLQHSCITFAVVTFNDEKTVIMDSAPDEYDIYDTDEYKEYVEESDSSEVEVSYEYFVLGADVEAEYATDKQKAYILENLEDVTAEATSLEGTTFTAIVPEKEIEQEEEKEPVEQEQAVTEPEQSKTYVEAGDMFIDKRDGNTLVVDSVNSEDLDGFAQMREERTGEKYCKVTKTLETGGTVTSSERVADLLNTDRYEFIGRQEVQEQETEAEITDTSEKKTVVELGDRFRSKIGGEEYEVTDLNGSPYPDYFNDDQVKLTRQEGNFLIEQGISPKNLLDTNKYEFIGNSRTVEEREQARQEIEKKSENRDHVPEVGDVYKITLKKDNGKSFETYGVINSKNEDTKQGGYFIGFREFYKNKECSKPDKRTGGSHIVRKQDYILSNPAYSFIGTKDELQHSLNDQVSFFNMPTEPKSADNIHVGDVFRGDNGDKKVLKIEDDTVTTESIEEIGGKDYAIEDTISKDDLVNDNAYVGNAIEEAPAEEEPLTNFASAENLIDYRIEDIEDLNAGGGKKERFRKNVEAIRTLKAIEDEARSATADEQKILAQYGGWGDLSEAFDKRLSNWSEEYEELKSLLTADEYNRAKASTNNAHYTSPVVIEAMYKALDKMGFKGGRILDPSVGTGNFLGAMPEEMYKKSHITGVEIDSITGRIAHQLYQSADIQVKGYEETKFLDNSFDVAISNVPFGDYKVYDKDYNNLNYNIHDYFFAKSLDKVHPGGIVAFVTSSGTMDKQNESVRTYLAERAEFIGAIRLPNTAFKGIAGTTEVTSDIIFLQKRDEPISINPEKEGWINRESITVDDPRYSLPERNSVNDIRVGDRYHFIDHDNYRGHDNFSFTAEISDITSYRGTITYHFSDFKYDDPKVHDELHMPIMEKTDYLSKYFNNYNTRCSAEFLGNSLEEQDRYTTLNINEYFVKHPEMVAGHIEFDTNPKSSGMTCEPNDGDLRTELDNIIGNLSAEYRAVKKEKAEKADNVHEEIAPAGSSPFSYIIYNDKLYFRDATDIMRPAKVKKDDVERVKALIGLVTTTKELLTMEGSVSNEDNETIQNKLDELNSKYDAFVEKYGRIGEDDNIKVFREDNNIHLLKSLENWEKDEDTKEMTFIGKADILNKRLIQQEVEINHVDNAADALIVSMSEKLKVDLEFMSRISGIPEEKLIEQLEGQIYQDPEKNMDWVPAAEYLSGNIYNRIEAAEKAGLRENAIILSNYIPKRIEAEDIRADLGSTWISPEYVRRFLIDELHLNYSLQNKLKVEYSELSGAWSVKCPKCENNSYVCDVYGNKDMNAFDIAENLLNLKKMEVKYPVRDKNGDIVKDQKDNTVYRVDKEATEDVTRLGKKMNTAFHKWLFNEPNRRHELVDKYNKIFNAFRPREYDGSFLNFNGKNKEVTLQPHQVNAIARALLSGNTLLAHEVGAGKTYEMIGIAMEGKRLGLHRKSLICTPNHLTEQFGNEFRHLYPNAKILVATSEDFSTEKRKDLIAKIATGDWDAVIIGHSQIGKLGVSYEKQKEFIDKRIAIIDRIIDEAGSMGKKSFSVKQAESMKKKLERKLKDALDLSKKEGWINFEQLGVDKLFLDESQEFKNLGAITKMDVPGIGTSISDRAINMKSITEYLDEKTGYCGTVFATGTPASNSLSEVYTVMEYLMTDKLKELNLDLFDKWASNFGVVTTDDYLKADSSGNYEQKQKFTNIKNVAEFQTIFRMVADIKTAETLNLDRPEAHVHTLVAKPSRAQKKYIKEIGERAEKIHNRQVTPKEDNMLKITSDGRKCGLDMRCIDPNIPDNPNSKLNMCVANLFDIYNKTNDKKGTQLVFCDLATPKKNPSDDTFTLYQKTGEGTYSRIMTTTCGITDKYNRCFQRLNKRLEGLDEKRKKENFMDANEEYYEEYRHNMPPVGTRVSEGDIVVLQRVDKENSLATNVAYRVLENNQLQELTSTDLINELGIEETEVFDPTERFSAYDDIKEKLVKAGIPENEIAFIHDAKTEEDKSSLYQAMNKGSIRIMIGSSAKCGAGMNAQKKMVAIHHLDAPLRPSDMTQRDGRGVRQGNENKDIDIFRYVTDRTFDSYLYQILETKQKGFSQIMTDRPTDLRECEDIDSASLDYGITKAVCAGNPLIKEYTELKRDVANMRNERSQILGQKHKLEDKLIEMPTKIENLEKKIARTQADFDAANNVKPDIIKDEKGNNHESFPVKILGKTYHDKEEAGQAIASIIAKKKGTILQHGLEIGEYKGMRITLTSAESHSEMANGQQTFDGLKNSVCITLIAENDRYATTPINDTGDKKIGIVLRMNNAIDGISKKIDFMKENLENMKNSTADIQQAIYELTFDDDALLSKEQHMEEVKAQLALSANDKSYQGRLYYSLTDMFPQVLENKEAHLHFTANGYMPLTIERHDDMVYMSHNYTQNGDLMDDPLVIMKIDEESRTAKLMSCSNSGNAYHQEFDQETTIEQEQSCAEFMETWFDNIEVQGFEQCNDPEQYRRELEGINEITARASDIEDKSDSEREEEYPDYEDECL